MFAVVYKKNIFMTDRCVKIRAVKSGTDAILSLYWLVIDIQRCEVRRWTI